MDEHRRTHGVIEHGREDPALDEPAGLQNAGLPSKPIRTQPSLAVHRSGASEQFRRWRGGEMVESGADHGDLRLAPCLARAC